MKEYEPVKLVAASRYRRYFPTLSAEVRRTSTPACVRSYGGVRLVRQGQLHPLGPDLTSIALYEALQANGAHEEEAYRVVSEEMWAYLDPSVRPWQGPGDR